MSVIEKVISRRVMDDPDYEIMMFECTVSKNLTEFYNLYFTYLINFYWECLEQGLVKTADAVLEEYDFCEKYMKDFDFSEFNAMLGVMR